MSQASSERRSNYGCEQVLDIQGFLFPISCQANVHACPNYQWTVKETQVQCGDLELFKVLSARNVTLQRLTRRCGLVNISCHIRCPKRRETLGRRWTGTNVASTHRGRKMFPYRIQSDKSYGFR